MQYLMINRGHIVPQAWSASVSGSTSQSSTQMPWRQIRRSRRGMRRTIPSYSNLQNYTIWIMLKQWRICDVTIVRKKEKIPLSPMKKPLTPTENSKNQSDNTKTQPQTLVTQRLRADLGHTIGVTTAIQLVYGISCFPLTAKAVVVGVERQPGIIIWIDFK